MSPELVTPASTDSRRHPPPVLALVLGGAALLLTIAAPLLDAWAHELTFGQLLFFVIVVPFAIVGFVLARRVPANPIGWIMLMLALAAMFAADDGTYAVRAFRLHDHALPLPRAAAFMAVTWVWMVVLIPLPIALFPDGRVAVRRLRWTLPAYGVLAALLVGTFLWQDATVIGSHPLHVDSSGEPDVFGQKSPTGWVGTDEHVLFPLYAAFSLTWVLMHVVSFRRAVGVRRQQLKWLIAGGAVCITGIAFGIVFGTSAVSDLGWAAITALPAGIGVAILRYRLYDLERLISRTLSYLIVTGLLAGVFVGSVALATDVLPFSSPVGVAASTLAAVALFNPLRRRVQHTVDRQFNRARYDADAILAEFSGRLRDAVDIETVGDELMLAVRRAMQPSHVGIWLHLRAQADGSGTSSSTSDPAWTGGAP